MDLDITMRAVSTGRSRSGRTSTRADVLHLGPWLDAADAVGDTP
jgi:hypothetical protein